MPQILFDIYSALRGLRSEAPEHRFDPAFPHLDASCDLIYDFHRATPFRARKSALLPSFSLLILRDNQRANPLENRVICNY